MLSKNAIDLLEKRYTQGTEKGKDVFKRVANTLALSDKTFERKLYNSMVKGYFLPNSPCLMNAGNKKGLLHACFCLHIGDSMKEIFATLDNVANIFKFGGGCGINFSPLRPKNASLSNGGTSSGVISFMEIFDKVTEAVKQGGRRRGALMGILNIDHPEIIDYITSKIQNNLTNFNISVMVTDDFMKKVENNEKIQLKFNKEIWNEVDANNLFDIIAFSAWKTGDPGILFYDRINKDNSLWPKTKIDTVNPCITGDSLISTTIGEIPIRDLAYNNRSKEADVYCMDEKGKLTIRRAKNIRVTGGQGSRGKKIVKINTVNGSIKCTLNHKIFTKNKGWVEAGKLKKNDIIVGLIKENRGKGYIGVRLNIQTRYETKMEHKFITGYYFNGVSDSFDTHHIDDDKHNNKITNLQVLPHSIHSSEQRKGNKDYNRGENKFISKENKKQKIYKKLDKKWSNQSYKVLSIEECGKEIVFDMEVPGEHNFIANGMVVHNCSEVALPHYGACCLGSINISKFVKNNSFDFKKYGQYVEIATRTLLNMNNVSWYPLQNITNIMKDLNPIGVGVMGFADALIKLGIYYDSDEALKFIDDLSKVYKEVTNKIAPKSFYKRIIAPTGSLSILADCSSSIEPVFERAFTRKLTIGVIEEVRDIYKSKYCRTAMEVSPEWHLKIQAKWQEHLDGGLSKTINLSNGATVTDIKNIYINAWKAGTKGVTVFREGSKEGVLQKRIIHGKCEGEVCHL